MPGKSCITKKLGERQAKNEKSYLIFPMLPNGTTFILQYKHDLSKNLLDLVQICSKIGRKCVKRSLVTRKKKIISTASVPWH